MRVLSRRIFIPRAVAQEIEAKGEGDLVVQGVRESNWIEIVGSDLPHPELSQWDLGRGEAAVLAWAQAHPGTLAILGQQCRSSCSPIHLRRSV